MYLPALADIESIKKVFEDLLSKFKRQQVVYICFPSSKDDEWKNNIFSVVCSSEEEKNGKTFLDLLVDRWKTLHHTNVNREMYLKYLFSLEKFLDEIDGSEFFDSFPFMLPLFKEVLFFERAQLYKRLYGDELATCAEALDLSDQASVVSLAESLSKGEQALKEMPKGFVFWRWKSLKRIRYLKEEAVVKSMQSRLELQQLLEGRASIFKSYKGIINWPFSSEVKAKLKKQIVSDLCKNDSFTKIHSQISEQIPRKSSLKRKRRFGRRLSVPHFFRNYPTVKSEGNRKPRSYSFAASSRC